MLHVVLVPEDLRRTAALERGADAVGADVALGVAETRARGRRGRGAGRARSRRCAGPARRRRRRRGSRSPARWRTGRRRRRATGRAARTSRRVRVGRRRTAARCGRRGRRHSRERVQEARIGSRTMPGSHRLVHEERRAGARHLGGRPAGREPTAGAAGGRPWGARPLRMSSGHGQAAASSERHRSAWRLTPPALADEDRRRRDPHCLILRPHDAAGGCDPGHEANGARPATSAARFGSMPRAGDARVRPGSRTRATTALHRGSPRPPRP